MAENLVEDTESWRTWSPTPALAPIFRAEKDESGRKVLAIAGGGNSYCFGRWSRYVPVKGGKTYRFRVRFRFSGINDLNLHVLNMLVWRVGDRPENQCPQYYIGRLYREREYVIGEQVFAAPKQAKGANLGLLLRFSAEGEVKWNSVELIEDKPQEPRFISVATMRARPSQPSTPEKNLSFWTNLIDLAATPKPDLICLPEAMNAASVINLHIHELAEPIPGPTYNMLAEKAKKCGMYICGCFYERDGDFVFNTAVLFDRKGNLVGKYRKVHPYWPEEVAGCSPGDDLQVYRTDFGTVGIIVCYDSWFAETSRLLGLKGAEIILFPNAGYERKILPARAIDNNVYFVVASLNRNAVIMDTLGNPMAETSVEGVISAKIDINNRPTPHPNAGGNLNESPGGRRGTRNSRSLKLYQEILQEIANWESRRQ